MDIEEKEVRCPTCNSLLLKVFGDPCGKLQIACRKCKSLVQVSPKVTVFIEVIKTKNQRTRQMFN